MLCFYWIKARDPNFKIYSTVAALLKTELKYFYYWLTEKADEIIENKVDRPFDANLINYE